MRVPSSFQLRSLLGVVCAVFLCLVSAFVQSAPLRIAIISDLNGGYGSTHYRPGIERAVSRIIALQPDLVISTGDMVAGQRVPHLDRAHLESMWAAFHRTVTDPLTAAGIPLAVTVGNHDGSSYGGFELERTVFVEQWRAHRPSLNFIEDGDYPLRYSFSMNGALFVALDASSAHDVGRDQLAWLERHLASPAAFERRVLFGHLPPWPLAKGREHEYIGSDELRELLQRDRVDLFLSGHHHAFYPGSIGETALVGQACLGSGPRPLLGRSNRSRRAFTLIEMDADTLWVAALAEPDFDRAIDWTALPERIDAGGTELVRADLAGVAESLLQIETP